MAKKIESIPAARRTMTALKDFGYDLNSAVADIVDNSISRGKAKNIHIDLIVDKKAKLHLTVIDDGVGMDSKRLEEAMRLGSDVDDYEVGDLSKYGMGMKTASNSQAMTFTVISKRKGSVCSAFQWDQNYINKFDRWNMFKLDNKEISAKLNFITENIPTKSKSIIQKDSWTIIYWEELTTLQKKYDSYSSKITSTNWLNGTIDYLETYLRLVYSRFLSGEYGAKLTNVYLCNRKLVALDPFCKSEKHTKEISLSEKNANFIIDDSLPPIVIRRYLLPTNPSKGGANCFSSIENWKEAKGTLSWNEAQGYYVYRNNRLINWGGWYRTRALDEHDKLARACIELTQEHDTLFTIDVKKTRIQFPEELKNHLKDNVNAKLIAEAKKRYAGSEKTNVEIKNPIRQKSKIIEHLSAELIKQDNISVTKGKNDKLIINNGNGTKISNDITYKSLEIGHRIISMPFGDSTYFWKMAPNPNNEFQVLVNTDHPFYEKVYGDAEKDKKSTSIMDAFLYTMAFVELKCISNNNELLFEQMREVASTVLNKFIDKKIL